MTGAEKKAEEKNVRVAIVGGGPAGIGAAVGLAKRGIGPILLLERWDQLGGVPAKYPTKSGSVPTYVAYSQGRVLFGEQYVAGLLRQLAKTSVEVSLETSVIDVNLRRRQLTAVNPQQGTHLIQADALVFATGAREQTAPERGWIAGSRRMPVLQTMQLLELLNRGKRLAWDQAVVAGSDLIAYAAAAKLKAAGANQVGMVDTSRRQRTPLLARWYFQRWVRPQWQQQAAVHLKTESGVRPHLEVPGAAPILCDALIVSGQLVPNSELLVQAGIETTPPSHVPITSARGQLSAPGCFAVGNLLGGFHGGQWCHRNGRRIAAAVDSYLKMTAATQFQNE